MIVINHEAKMTKKDRFIKLFSDSLIIGALSRFTDWIYKCTGESLIGRILTGQAFGKSSEKRESTDENENGKIKIGFSIKTKRFFMRGFEQSLLIRIFSKFMNSLLAKTFKYYGIFSLSFGLITCLSSFVRGQQSGGLFDVGCLCVGIGMIVFAVIMLFSDKTVGEALCESKFSDFILFRFLGFRRNVISVNGKKHKGYTACAAGLLLGSLSFIVEPYITIIALAGIAAMYIVLLYPEIGVVLIITALPFLTTMMLVGLTLWTFFAFVIKLLRGKRTIKFERFDIALLIFMGIYILGGIVSVDTASSCKASMVFVCFMLSYILVVNLVNTTEKLFRCIHGMLLSSLLVSLIGVLQYVTGSADSLWQDTTMFSDISGRVVSTFANPNVLAEYLILMLPFAGAMLITSENKTERAFYPLTFASLAICLIFTWSRGAWLGFMVSAILFVLIWSRKFMVAGMFGLLAFPVLPFILPDNIVSRFTSIGNLGDSSTSYRVSIWRGVSKMLKDYFYSGIGIGEGAFSKVYPRYSYAGIELAPHSHNLYFQITAETGIVALIVFLILILLFARGSFSFFCGKKGIYTYGEKYEKRMKLFSAAGFCGVFAVLLQGVTDYVWYNYRIFLLFWLIIGLTSAIGRTARADRIYRDGQL